MVTIPERTFNFGVKIIELASNLPKSSSGLTISSQIVRSGTSIGANVEEAQNAGSRKEFIRGMTIALKEARETYYWLRLINEANLLDLNKSDILGESIEIIKILTSSIKNAKKKI